MVSLNVIRNSDDQAFLTAFLASSQRPAYTMNFYQLDGYFRALCCGFGKLTVANWLPLIFSEEDPQYASPQEQYRVLGILESLYCFHEQQVDSQLCDLPFTSTYSSERSDRIDQEQWARGFMQGYIYWQDQWNSLLEYVPEETSSVELFDESLAEEMDAVLYIVATVADADFAVVQGTDVNDLDHLFKQLPKVVITLSQIARRTLSVTVH